MLRFPKVFQIDEQIKPESHRRRWKELCEFYLPVRSETSVWRFNRESKPQEPSQGWKLHISASILGACDLFERVAPFLTSEDVQFKAPKSLDELSNLNGGLQYGYQQVGKFITVYPSTDDQAIYLAENLHKLTEDFSVISVPYDEQYRPNSSVFYRYGGFSKIEITGENGKIFLAIKNPAGEFVPDDRLQAIPEWVSNPFQNKENSGEKSFKNTPLGTTYRVFRAITQRGKGGTYQAFDFSQTQPRLCIVKEGRQNGDLGWNGQDGYLLVQNEYEVLKVLNAKYDAVPQVFESFEIHGNFYFAMEYVDGKSLEEMMNPRRKRFSIKQVLKFAVRIADIIENIHQTGWVWNDCKPANLIVTKNKSLRPIDFENAYPGNQSEPFDWKSKGFSKLSGGLNVANGKFADYYALGAVIYFLLTGKLFDNENPKPIKKMRRGVPQKLIEITETLLFDSDLELSETKREFEKLLKTL